MTFDQADPLYVIFAVVFGAIMGSFFNMLIYRVPRGISILTPLSFCPACGQSIPWWANIPIVSYLLLKRKCAYCKEPIPIRYLLVELITPAAYVLLYLKNVNTGIFQWGIEALFVSLLIIITFTDIETYIIPDVFSIGGIFAGIALSPWNANLTFVESIVGILVGGGVLLLVAYGYYKVRGIEGMGGGDVKLLAMIGAFTGWKGAILALFSSALIGAIAGLIIIFSARKDKSEITESNETSSQSALYTMIPYGPFLAIGGLGALLWGNTFWNWYLSGF